MNNRILIMDDDETLLEYYRVIFASKDLKTDTSLFNVELVEHGRAGINKVKEFKEQDQFFSVAFIDVNMPPGINGIETAKKILEIDPNMYIIFVTAVSDQDLNNIDILDEDNVLYVKKPFSRDEIFQLARTLNSAWNNKQNYLDMLNGEQSDVQTVSSGSSGTASGLTDKVSQMLGDVSEISKNVQQIETVAQGFQAIHSKFENNGDERYSLSEQYVKAIEVGVESLSEISSSSLKHSADHLMQQLRLLSDDVHASK
jgi:DNA-binding NtrC family response regulator